MKLLAFEENWIKDGSLKAVIRNKNIMEKVGENIFSIDGTVYVLKEKKRWSMQRCVAKRVTDWGTNQVSIAKSRLKFLYGCYEPKKIVYLIIFERSNNQETLL